LPRGSTEIIGDDDSDESDEAGPPMSVHSMAERAEALRGGKPKNHRAQTSLTNLSKLKGVELTSIINMIEGETDGAAPLVDLDQLGRGSGKIPSGPRLRDSGDDLGAVESTTRRRPDSPPVRGDRPGAPPTPPGAMAMVTPTPDPRDPRRDPRRPSSEAARRKPATGTAFPFRIKAWMVIAVVVVIGAIIALVVGMSGTKVGPAHGPAPKTGSAGSSTGSASK